MFLQKLWRRLTRGPQPEIIARSPDVPAEQPDTPKPQAPRPVNVTMLVRRDGRETQMAVIEDGVLVDYVTEDRPTNHPRVGDIYIGIIRKVDERSAFVQLGAGKDGFVRAQHMPHDGPLTDHYRDGDPVLVQVSGLNESTTRKGPKLTGLVRIEGHALTLRPLEPGVRFLDRHITDKAVRRTCHQLLDALIDDNYGVEASAAIASATDADSLVAERDRLHRRWRTIWGQLEAARRGNLTEPKRVARSAGPILAEIRRRIAGRGFNIVAQGDQLAEEIRQALSEWDISYVGRVQAYRQSEDLFERHGVVDQLHAALDRRANMAGGGYLIIDRTEAGVVVDVNTGTAYTKGADPSDAARRVNLEAADEVARQIRLRNLSGMIFVDFAGSGPDVEGAFEALTEAVATDRVYATVALCDPNLGIAVVTRKRTTTSLLDRYSHVCRRCDGSGVVVDERAFPQTRRSDAA